MLGKDADTVHQVLHNKTLQNSIITVSRASGVPTQGQGGRNVYNNNSDMKTYRNLRSNEKQELLRAVSGQYNEGSKALDLRRMMADLNNPNIVNEIISIIRK